MFQSARRWEHKTKLVLLAGVHTYRLDDLAEFGAG